MEIQKVNVFQQNTKHSFGNLEELKVMQILQLDIFFLNGVITSALATTHFSGTPDVSVEKSKNISILNINLFKLFTKGKKHLKFSKGYFEIFLSRPIFVNMCHFTTLHFIVQDVTSTKDVKPYKCYTYLKTSGSLLFNDQSRN